MSHYETLGVSDDATQDEIKKAYRKKAQASHPDREGGNQEQFTALSIAYGVLSDPEKREYYDRTGKDEKTDIEGQAYQALANLFAMMVDGDHLDGNLIKRAKSILSENVHKEQSSLNREKTKIKKHENLLGRIEAKSKINVFENMLLERISGFQSTISVIEERLAIMEVVKDLLDDFLDTNPITNKAPDAVTMDELREKLRSMHTGFNPYGFDPTKFGGP